MRLSAVSRAAGLALAADLPSVGAGNVPMLRAGATLTDRLCQALITQGINAVWVQDELSEGIEPVTLLPEDVRQQAAASARDALNSARDAFARQQPMPEQAVRELQQTAQRISELVAGTPDAALALTDLAAADAYTHRHSVNVCALGLLLANTLFRRNGWVDWDGRRRYDRVEERLAKLGLGLLVHDVGKMAVPLEVLNKPGKLDEDEWELMRQHPEAGVSLLRADSISPLVKAVVRDHHERWDGSGYPRGIEGEQINALARIAAVADVYDAVTSERPYKAAAPAHVGVKIIVDGSGTAFDPEVVEIFRRVVFPYPVGTPLRLDDEQVTGVVCRVDPDHPDTPVVRFPGQDGPVEVPVDTRARSVSVVL